MPETEHCAYVNVRTMHRDLPGASRTCVHLFPHGGMGDRILLEGILRQRLAERQDGDRIILVIPYHGGEFDAHSYRTWADELWVVQDIGTLAEAVERLGRVCADFFPGSATLVRAYFDVGEDFQPPESNCRPYRYLTQLAAAGGYPRFPLDLEETRKAQAMLAAAGRDGRRPLIAVHVRQADAITTGDPHKNPVLADVVALLGLLRDRTDAQFLVFSGLETLPESLSAFALMPIPFDKTLQTSAGLLAHCDLFIGGDSGPGHLAASLDCPVVSLRPPSPNWCNGPFNRPERVLAVVGSHQPGRPGVSFDPEQALAAALRLLPGQPEPAPPGPAPWETGLPWAAVLQLGQELEPLQHGPLRVPSGSLALFQRTLDGLLYLLDGGESLEWVVPVADLASFAQVCAARIPARLDRFSLVTWVAPNLRLAPTGQFLAKSASLWSAPGIRLGAQPPSFAAVEPLFLGYPQKPILHLDLEPGFRPPGADWCLQVAELLNGVAELGVTINLGAALGDLVLQGSLAGLLKEPVLDRIHLREPAGFDLVGFAQVRPWDGSAGHALADGPGLAELLGRAALAGSRLDPPAAAHGVAPEDLVLRFHGPEKSLRRCLDRARCRP